ncbi:unnamed protein product [Fraxinus pennsylvanica]|uniref:Uncharacterized protein n=1 Tax=Fraxinus pennsylvanica TaxID=56036 RepID=A0AAD2E0I0_9LAMI|nr:unnamed protein product [Fraxinus pennsylvanica]
MCRTRADSVTVNIDNMLKNLSSTPSKPSMFRVGDHLRSINPEAYDPQIIAIGPFHRSKPNLQNMEQHKVRYLKLFLERREGSSVQRYVNTIRELKDTARKCYAEDIQLDEDEFMEMLILDGCFIIEFLYMFQHREHREVDDPIFQYGHIQSHLFHDLMVFENQIPFFIIDSLIKINNGYDINSLIWPLLQNGIFPVQAPPEGPINGHHLLGIVHGIQCSSFAMILSQMGSRNPDQMVNINSALELKEAGISFKKSEGNSFFGIEFKNKAMIIPEWEISDSTESLFRNLIAYEYYLTGITIPQKYVTDYVFFMHCLVHSPEDAKLLRRNGIISNFLGSDEMVYNLINQLGKNSIISEEFSYFKIFNRVNEHCRHRRNRWMGILRRKYFNSPWALISVFAATALLILAIIQATFAILSYRHDLKNGN